MDMLEGLDIWGPLMRSTAEELRELARMIDPARYDPPGTDPNEFDPALPALAHELVALQSAFNESQQFSSWVGLERIMLHARIIYSFFWPDPRNRVISARNFVANWPEEDQNVIRRTFVMEMLDHFDSELAGLTRSRLTEAHKQRIDLGRVVDTAWDGCRLFLERLGRDARAGTFRWNLQDRAYHWKVEVPPGVL